VNKLVPRLAIIAVAAIPSLAAGQTLSDCGSGRPVANRQGDVGVIAGTSGESCLVKYHDGRTQAWVPLSELRAAAPTKPGAAAAMIPPAPATAAPPVAAGVAVLRPTIVNRLVYPADPLGHVVLTGVVNAASVRFMVDTGASLVCLTPEDAHAAGLKRDALTFSHIIQTANGPVHAASVVLRELRIEQFAADDVQAVVIDSLKQSVLGMSFLKRLKGFEIRDGALTMTW